LNAFPELANHRGDIEAIVERGDVLEGLVRSAVGGRFGRPPPGKRRGVIRADARPVCRDDFVPCSVELASESVL
jgi:hypothetical protein